MKPDIHPPYRPVVFRDQGAGEAFVIPSTIATSKTIDWEGATLPLHDVDVSNLTHPFFTGTMRIVDTAGRVERFERRYGAAACRTVVTAEDLVIVGAGPQALALALALLEQGRREAEGLLVVDPSGAWLTAWRDRFGRHRIDRLRSAAVHHPHPDPHRLRLHARSRDRLDELHHPYDLPSTALFEDFCASQVHGAGLERAVRSGTAVLVTAAGSGAEVHLADGEVLAGRHVVLATNPVRPLLPPEALLASRSAVHHSDQVDLRERHALQGRSVEVVGGGLTAVQLAVGAAGAGAQVRLRSRRPLVPRQFDVEPGWLGPRELDRYRRCSHQRRRRLVDRARGGGSVPPGDLQRLRASPVVQVVDEAAAASAMASDADEVWFATGYRLDATTDPVLAHLRTHHPTPIYDGLPQLGRHLEWPGTPIHLVGGYAALALGPAARNLWGARWASQRLLEVLEGG